MLHLGDITRIHGAGVPAVEVVIGGSPCQDLSVAGKRAGLDGERSGLFMDQIRIIKEMRDYDKRVNARTGADVRPRYMVWENVPGAFSSAGGEDFRAVLEETAHIAEKDAVIPRPENGKWQTAGCIMGDGWSIAWRVLDAQFWGVPQRRRRIALVADFGGDTAPEILFERESVSGDSQESGTAWEGTAADAERCAGDAVYGLDHVMLSGGTTYQGRGWYVNKSGCLKTQPHGVCCLNDQGGSVMSVSEDVAGTLRAQEHGHQPAICIQGNCIDRADTAGCNGKGWRDDDISFTLNTVDRPAVYDARGNGDGAVVPTITGDHESRVTDYTAVCIGNGQADIASHITEDVAQTLNYMHDQQAVMCTVGALCARDYKGVGSQYVDEGKCVAQNSIVRRLTPLECERLQGFPDGWTDIGEWVDSKGKKHESSDSARYKALGNSIALPPWRFVLGRLNAYLMEHTMASLFDGIGGFPLIWRELNGDGKCLWASEIEEFPIAVTKRRFGDELQ